MSDLEQRAIKAIEEFPQKESDDEALERLAAMSILEYDRARNDEAASMGVSVTALDKAVNDYLKKNKVSIGEMPDVEPWAHPINPDELLSNISDSIRRFIVCDIETADAATLWVTMTWFMDVVQIAPLAVITAPEKRCGKTQLLTILGRLSYRPISASNISTAALYRCIDAWSPTLLLDETDAYMKENEDLRGVINSGHSRENAYVIRTVGDNFTPTRFSTWGAKVLSGIGHLSDTLIDRSIVLKLRRKLNHETVERLRYAEPDLFSTLTRKLARFKLDYSERIRKARPILPPTLNDRAQDNWEPLLAIAESVSKEWLERANMAALKLSGNDQTDSLGNELITDIQELLETKKVAKISTADLIRALIEDEEKCWATYNRGKPLSPRQLANYLRGYGIHSKTIRFNNVTAKGYELDQFTDTFNRYLTSKSTFPSVTPSQTNRSKYLNVTYRVVVPVTNFFKRNKTIQNVRSVRI